MPHKPRKLSALSVAFCPGDRKPCLRNHEGRGRITLQTVEYRKQTVGEKPQVKRRVQVRKGNPRLHTVHKSHTKPQKPVPLHSGFHSMAGNGKGLYQGISAEESAVFPIPRDDSRNLLLPDLRQICVLNVHSHFYAVIPFCIICIRKCRKCRRLHPNTGKIGVCTDCFSLVLKKIR